MDELKVLKSGGTVFVNMNVADLMLSIENARKLRDELIAANLGDAD